MLRKFRESHPRVRVNRKVIELNSNLLPVFPEAKEVNLYFNADFEPDKAIIEGLTSSSFVFKTGECYIDLVWLKSVIQKVKDMTLSLELEEALRGGSNGH